MKTATVKNLIIGAGVSGLIAGMEFTKRGEDYMIIEKQSEFPKARLHYLHGDLREYFPFKMRPVDVVTNIYWKDQFYSTPTIEMMNKFSCSTVNKVVQNSMKFIDGGIHQGWVPENGIENISENLLNFNKVHPELGVSVTGIDWKEHIVYMGKDHLYYDTIINTMPLPSLLKSCNLYPTIEFKTEPLHMTEIELSDDYYEDLYQIVYIPEAINGVTRFSVLGKRIVAERGCPAVVEVVKTGERNLDFMLDKFFPNAKGQFKGFKEETNWYGRYVPIKESDRSEIIHKLSEFGIHCLGRYAEWTYKRADHIAIDAVKLIESLH